LEFPSGAARANRVQFGDDIGATGSFSNLVRPVTLEMDSAPVGSASTQSFTDDFTSTDSQPAQGSRYYRVQIVK